MMTEEVVSSPFPANDGICGLDDCVRGSMFPSSEYPLASLMLDTQ